MLNRRDMNDDARSPRKHRRQQPPVQPHGWHQIQIDLLVPLRIIECGKPARRCLRPAKNVHDDVDGAKMGESALGDCSATDGRREVRRDVMHARDDIARQRPGSGHDVRTRLRQNLDDRGSDAFRPAGHERATTGELEVEDHGLISSLATLSPSTAKWYRSSRGLPGKSPVSRARTTTSSPKTSTVSGSLV